LHAHVNSTQIRERRSARPSKNKKMEERRDGAEFRRTAQRQVVGMNGRATASGAAPGPFSSNNLHEKIFRLELLCIQLETMKR